MLPHMRDEAVDRAGYDANSGDDDDDDDQASSSSASAQLSVLCRTPDQVIAVCVVPTLSHPSLPYPNLTLTLICPCLH